MAIVPVHAYGFAATFKLRELVPLFEAPGVEPRIKERLVAKLGEGRWVLAYDFGAVVFVGVPADEQVRMVHLVSRRLPAEPRPPMTENFLIEVNGASVVPQIQFDRVVVADLTQDVVDIVALALAQSVALDYYAKDVEEIEVETDRIADALRATGRVPGSVRGMTKFIGLCIATRNDVISTLALFDKPDVTWESEALDRLWDGVYRMLEIDDRYRALEAKLHMFQDNLVVLVDLTRQRHTLALEVIVALLILGEMGIMVWQIMSAHG